MERQFLKAEELQDQLNQWKDAQVKITKHELDDVDEIYLDLRRVGAVKNESIDDYVPPYSLQLYGNGVVGTTMSQFEQMPAETFEIPLESDGLYEYDGERLIASTSRGVYVIERV